MLKKKVLLTASDYASMMTKDAHQPVSTSSVSGLSRGAMRLPDTLGPDYDTIVEAAQGALQCKIVLFSLIDDQGPWLGTKRGLEIDQISRDYGFWAQAVGAGDILIVPDATADLRFADDPLFNSAQNICFYAGIPIRVPIPGETSSLPVGTLCVVDDRPRQPTEDEILALTKLASLIETLLAVGAEATRSAALAEQRGRALHELDRTHRQFRQAERMANIGSWRLNIADNRTEWSEQTYAIHGLPAGSGEPLIAALDFYPPHAREIVSAAVARTMATGEPFDIETDFITAQGDHRRVRSIGELELSDGVPVALIGVFQDVTQRHAMEQALRQIAYTDDLTRIASRSRFNQQLDEKIEIARHDDQPLALLLIDLDHFKTVNDRCGHLAGDDVLRKVASRLQAPYLADGFAARLGGDEFVLLLTGREALTDLSGLIRRLLGDLRHSISAGSDAIPVSATIGACWLDADIDNRSALLQRADTALYQAKARQRGSAIIAGRDELILVDQPPVPSLRAVR